MSARPAGAAARWLPRRPEQVALLVAALTMAFAIKSFYARATFDDLRWLLAPTATLAGAVGGGVFELEAHAAYLSRDAHFAIVPACAGLNFTTVVLVSLAAGALPLVRGWGRAAAWLCASAAIAVGATVIAGALRIGLAMRLHRAGCGDDVLRAEGIAVYLICLVVVYVAAAGWGERFHGAHRAT